MQYYRCKCGNRVAWASSPMPPCRGCDECNTTLAQYPNDHKVPEEHSWVVRYDTNNGKPYEVCEVCNNRKPQMKIAFAQPKDKEEDLLKKIA
jgi:hypothetical protein